MPVSLDEMMREIAPERRAEIETRAAALTADFRQSIDRADAADAESHSPLARAVSLKARTGQRCPESGVWRVEDNPSATAPITIDDAMPPHAGRTVTWVLVQYA